MQASKQRQLNIRSNEAHQIAHALSQKLGKTTTEVVLTALRQLAGCRTIPSTKVTPEEAEANFRMIMEMVETANRDRPPGGPPWDEDMYDEYGLPK